MSEKIKSIENSINDRLPDQLVGIVQCRPIYGAYCFAREWVFDFFDSFFIEKVDFWGDLVLLSMIQSNAKLMNGLYVVVAVHF